MTTTPRANPYQAVLKFGGAVAIVVGAIIALVGQREGKSADTVAQLVASMSNDPFYASATGNGVAYGWMWFGIILAILGVVMVIVYVAIKAASKPELTSAS